MENKLQNAEWLNQLATYLDINGPHAISNVQHFLRAEASKLTRDFNDENCESFVAVKTLRDEWAMTHYVELGMLDRDDDWSTVTQMQEAYRLADMAIAISKETGK